MTSHCLFIISRTVQEFDRFTEDNDPYGEHDFGSLEWHGEKVFWNIDYYDHALVHGKDPLSLNCSPSLDRFACERVLTHSLF